MVFVGSTVSSALYVTMCQPPKAKSPATSASMKSERVPPPRISLPTVAAPAAPTAPEAPASATEGGDPKEKPKATMRTMAKTLTAVIAACRSLPCLTPK